MKLFKNKKAQESGESGAKVPFYMIVAFILPVLMLAFAIVVATSSAHIYKMPTGVEEFVVLQRFTSSQECFAYVDKATGRAYAGIIDFTRFNQETLDSCYNIDEKSQYFAFQLMLKADNSEAFTKLKTKNWDGIAEKRIAPKDVLVYKDGQIYKGKLTVEVQNGR